MQKRVLIVTNREDLHADIVAARLFDAGAAPFRLDLDAFPDRFALTLRFDGRRWDGTIADRATGDEIAPADVGAVWMRKKGRFDFGASPLAAQERAFAEAEMDQVLFGLLYSLDCFWMSHPRAVRGAVWKNEQLLRAARMGFVVPQSLVTNSREGAERFWRDSAGGTVFKALSSMSLAADEVGPGERIAPPLPTTPIAAADAELFEAVEALPSFFQHRVAKSCEVRATVIGERVFAARIHSQDDPRTREDYRDFSVGIRYEAERLPAEVERRCLDFVHSYGLSFGAIDLIVTPDGDHVFLENNPVGQFLFVEQLVPELDMTGAVAACLAAGAAAQPG
jgi:glutathione synthase/RimK-type ligase-like ATP-grasp enzyme